MQIFVKTLTVRFEIRECIQRRGGWMGGGLAQPSSSVRPSFLVTQLACSLTHSTIHQPIITH